MIPAAPLFHLRRSLALLAVCTALLAGPGCTQISIQQSGGAVRVERSFGFATIAPPADGSAMVAEMTSFGYLASPIGTSVGYGHQQLAVMPESCHIILWVQDSRELQELQTLIGQNPNICTAGADQTENHP